MSKFHKALLGGTVAVAALVSAVWVNRVELLLSAVEVIAARRTPVGPNRPVEWASGVDPAGRAPGERPPNIILILADDLGWNDLTFGVGGVAGGTVPTPNIDSIAQEGVNFLRGYAANGSCAPSRAALTSGRYGTRYGFEFTPTPPGMMPMLQIMASTMDRGGPPRIKGEGPASLDFEEMGMPPSEITIAELWKARGYIGLPDVNDPFRGWKITLFEGGIHVPFFAKWPSRIPAGQTFDEPVQHFDMYATAAAAAGAELPSDRKMDGVDLVPFARGEAEGDPHERLFWRSGASQSVRIGRYKLNVSDPPGQEWLIDLEADPSERRDLSAELRARLAELRVALASHNAEQMESRWPSAVTTAININRELSQPNAPEDEFIYWSI